MQPLSAKECSTWLARQSIGESPYGSPLKEGSFYARFEVEPLARFAQALVFSFVGIAQQSKGALLQFTDKGVFGEFPVLGAFAELSILPQPEDKWPQHVTDGLLFNFKEDGTLLECCEYVLVEGASAYLYMQGAGVTAYMWESTFIELWCETREARRAVAAALVTNGAQLRYELDA
nr:hypothetical protein [uncultured Undibacterium sp.]